jgi:tellurite resistance protein
MERLDDQVGQAYAQALLAIARVDREVSPEESARVRELVAKRTAVEVDFEESFFDKMTPQRLANAAREGNVPALELGLALLEDGVNLATTDGDLNAVEAAAILRFARALGCRDIDIGGVTKQLDEFLMR